MEKHDYIWVGIRLFGVFLLVKAVLAIPDLLLALLLLCGYPSALTGMSEPTVGLLFTTALRQFGWSLSAVVIYGLVGLYLVRGGRLVFRWICPPQEPGALEPHVASPAPRPSGVAGCAEGGPSAGST